MGHFVGTVRKVCATAGLSTKEQDTLVAAIARLPSVDVGVHVDTEG
jgi:ATP phosphoribosyltransferase regulatory subunit HisZ